MMNIPRRQWYVWIPVIIILCGLWYEKSQFSGIGQSAGGHTHSSTVHYLIEHGHQVEMIEILRGGDRLPFIRRGNEWARMHPVDNHSHDDHGHANEHSHDQINETISQSIRAFLRTRIKRKFEYEGEDKSDYGLNTPNLTVHIYSSASVIPVQTIDFGDVAPDPFSRYVTTEQTGVVMTVADYQHKNLNALIDLVDHHTH